MLIECGSSTCGWKTYGDMINAHSDTVKELVRSSNDIRKWANDVIRCNKTGTVAVGSGLEWNFLDVHGYYRNTFHSSTIIIVCIEVILCNCIHTHIRKRYIRHHWSTGYAICSYYASKHLWKVGQVANWTCGTSLRGRETVPLQFMTWDRSSVESKSSHNCRIFWSVTVNIRITAGNLVQCQGNGQLKKTALVISINDLI